MGLVGLLANVAKGAAIGIATITALPIAGTVGTITATGATISSVVGGVAGAYDYVTEENKK